MTRRHHHHDTDFVRCRDCGREFDLARQTYYLDRCPDCLGGGSRSEI